MTTAKPRLATRILAWIEISLPWVLAGFFVWAGAIAKSHGDEVNWNLDWALVVLCLLGWMMVVGFDQSLLCRMWRHKVPPTRIQMSVSGGNVVAMARVTLACRRCQKQVSAQ